jgi:hypothetical protein
VMAGDPNATRAAPPWRPVLEIEPPVTDAPV